MANTKKKYYNRVQIMQRIPAMLLNRVDDLAKSQGISRNALINKALHEFIRAERIRILSDSALFKE